MSAYSRFLPALKGSQVRQEQICSIYLQPQPLLSYSSSVISSFRSSALTHSLSSSSVSTFLLPNFFVAPWIYAHENLVGRSGNRRISLLRYPYHPNRTRRALLCPSARHRRLDRCIPCSVAPQSSIRTRNCRVRTGYWCVQVTARLLLLSTMADE